MLFSTSTGRPMRLFGFEKGVSLYCEAGFPALDFTMRTDASVLPTDDDLAAVKRIADEHGVIFNQAHAPFGYANWYSLIEPKLPRIFEICSKLGVPRVVIHPLQPGPYRGHEKEIFDLNLAFYRGLIPLSDRAGVKIAIENMYRRNPVTHLIIDDICADPAELANLYDALDDPAHFTVCLDIGHAALCNREPEDLIRALGHDRLGALHVHDVDYKEDLHTLPGMSRIDWDKVCRALGEIDYVGELTLESGNFLVGFEEDFYPTAIRFTADRARYLANKVDAYRKKQ